ncbi:MAG: reverse transcriptase family protein, partial [Nitrososphaerales archaeon]
LNFIQAFESFWTALLEQKLSCSVNPLIWWDLVKTQIKGFCQQYQFFSTRADHEVKKILQLEILQLQPVIGQNNSNTQKTLTEKQSLLKEITERNARGALVRMRVRHLNEADVPTKYFFSLQKRLPSKQLSQLRLADSSITFTQSEIKLFVKEYFSKIYSMEQINPVSVASISVGLPVLCEDGRSQLERPITLDELGTALHGLAIGKAPGLDGLTTEFYKKFWHLLGPELLNTLNASCQLGELPQSCRRALLTLIPKKGDMLRIENWRPISLLCTDYKIFSKALASRLTPYLSSLLKEDQCYCVPKRSIYDNISLVRDIIELCKENPKDLGVLLLDQEKAFDRVDHRYLFEVLERFGLGSTFISYIKILYNNIYSVLKINNELVAPLSINKGLRQGCPLSRLLYALSIEPLLVSLRCRLTGVS